MKIRSTAFAPRPGKQFPIGGETFVIQGEPEPRDPDRPGWWSLEGLGSPRPALWCARLHLISLPSQFPRCWWEPPLRYFCVARCFQDTR
jgi:hypothetical protein